MPSSPFILDPSTFTATETSDYVTYVKSTPQGTFIIRVFTDSISPRILSFCQHGTERDPLSLFLDQILAFCQDAMIRKGPQGKDGSRTDLGE